MPRILYLSYNLDDTTLELLGCSAKYEGGADEFFPVERIDEIHQRVAEQNTADLDDGKKMTVFKTDDLSVFKQVPSCFSHDDCSTLIMSSCPFLDACSHRANEQFIKSYPHLR